MMDQVFRNTYGVWTNESELNSQSRCNITNNLDSNSLI